MSRRPSSNVVSLFPFLAVLMCALGALILLLLVTASRIHDQAVERAREAVESVEVAAVPAVPINPEPEPLPVEPEPLPEPVALPAPLPPPGPTAEELRAQWEQTVADLEQQAARLSALLAAEAESVQQGRTRLAAARSQLDDLQRQSATLVVQQADLSATEDDHARRRTALQQELAETERQIEQARRNREQQSSQYRILPYDGTSGTTRRPILIECTSTGLTFASEGITLTPEQLNGFAPIRNPLLAGADALITYWSVKDLMGAADEPAGKPYVLLIVRPGGTVGYYVARRLLESMQEPFGYELVTDDQEFRWPERDPQAAAVCQRAIDAVLSQRTRLQQQVAGGRLPVAGPLQFSNTEGEFYLEEVERLRGEGRTVHFGGRTFERTPGGGNGAPQPGNRGSTGSSTGHEGGPPGVAAPAPGPRVIEIPRGRSVAGASSQEQGFENGSSAGGDSAANADHERTGGTSPSLSGAPRTPPAMPSPEGTLYDGQVAPDAQAAAVANAATSENAWRPTGSGERSAAGSRTGSASSSRWDGNPGGSGGNEDVDPLAPRSPGVPLASGPGQVDPKAPQWGQRNPGSSIGLEREVIVRVDGGQVAVERELPIAITSGMTRDELQRSLAETLDSHIRDWGMPPKSFYWLPLIRYQVLPGGNQYLKRLTDVTDEWTVKSRVEYVLE